MLKQGIALILLCGFAVTGYCAGWDLFGEQQQLKGFRIADVGEVSEVPPPPNTEWRNKLYQFNDRCFTLSGYQAYWGYGTKAGMLLINDSSVIKVAILETGIGTVKIEVHDISLYHCP